MAWRLRLTIERTDDPNRPARAWAVRWAVLGLAVIGAAAVLIVRALGA